MLSLQRIKKIKLITVGTKVLTGVALATNLFIGVLVYVNLQSAIQLEEIVKDLDGQVSDQNNLVGEIVTKNKTSQAHMEELGQAVKEIEGYLDNLNEATSTIFTGITQQSGAVNTITDLAAKTSTNTHTVSSTIQQVNEAASKTSELSRKVYAHADEIAGQLTVLLEETTTKLQQVQMAEQENSEQKQKSPEAAPTTNHRIVFPDRRSAAPQKSHSA